MAVRLKTPKRPSEEIPQASMADIAFLLLIFFISTTIFNKEQGIPLSLPGASTAQVTMNPKNILKVTSDAEGNVYLGEELIAINLLSNEIEARLAENDKLVIAIESHPDSHYDVMVQILDEVKRAKAPRISLKMRLV